MCRGFHPYLLACLLACLRCYSRVLDLVRSLLLLASTRILASTGIGEDARCRSCVFPCYSHTLVLASTRFRPESVTRVYSHTRVSHLLAYSHLLVLVGTQRRQRSVNAQGQSCSLLGVSNLLSPTGLSDGVHWNATCPVAHVDGLPQPSR